MTPPEIYDPINQCLKFDLDACAADYQAARCERFISPEMDALQTRWADVGSRVWCNPPYGRALHKWFEAVTEEMSDGIDLCAMLVMANTDTSYWHRHVRGKASEIVFLSPRVRFLRPDGSYLSSAPKGSALVIYDNSASKQTIHSYWRYLIEPFSQRSP